uniref:Uncharacterized protein n=1 Tax=Panagrolaimus sp. JU765 TaxID=591449 RepID=A0AC34RR43_9BILA
MIASSSTTTSSLLSNVEFNKLMMIPGISELAKEKDCFTEYIKDYEDDRYRATLRMLFSLMNRYHKLYKKDPSAIFVGNTTTTTLDAAIEERKRQERTQRQQQEKNERQQGTQPCILMVHGYPEFAYYIYVEGCALRVIGNAFTALHWLFAVHEIFNLKYQTGTAAFWGFLDRLAEIQRPNNRYKVSDNNLMVALEMILNRKKSVSDALASLCEIMDENDENEAPAAQDPCCSKSLLTNQSSNAMNAGKQSLTPARRKRPGLPLTLISAVSEELEKLPRLQ